MNTKEQNWKFPLTGSGKTQGFKHSDKESFAQKDPYASLAREVVQNSLDARDKNQRLPVRVEFNLEQQASQSFPGKEMYLGCLEACLNNHSNEDEAAIEHYQNAIQTLNETQLPILKISDFNTSGLNKSTWSNLVKSSGVSANKEGTAGGSYGFGKYAPFLSSNVHAIFYSSLDQNGQYLFQGKSVLETQFHGDPDKETQGEGFYGLSHNLTPIDEKDHIDPFYQREQTGTDLFIMGFKKDEQWEAKIIIAILKNYFPALDQEKLVVVVGGKTLKKVGLKKMITEYGSDKYKAIKEAKNLSEYFEAYTAEEGDQNNPIVQNVPDIKGMGAVKIRTFEKEGFPKKEVYYRDSGMIIEERSHRGTIECISMVEIQGKDLSKFLRKIENPAHDKWEPERAKDSELATEVLTSIRKVVRETREELIKDEKNPEVDFKGMENFLPEDIDHVDEIDNDLINEKINKPAPIEMKKIKNKKNTNKVINEEDNSGDDGGSGGGDGEGGDGEGGGGGSSGGGGGDGEGGDDEGKKKPKYTKYSLNKIRVIETSQPGNIIVITSSGEDKLVYLELSAAAEDATMHELKIEKASWQGGEVDVNGDNNFIGPIDLKAGEEIKLHVFLEDKERMALGVDAHELK